MLHENYKKTLTGSQRTIFERLEHEIVEAINETQNMINALELLAYCPKKDGTPKANFSLNFGLVAPWGESYKAKRWNDATETNRFVDVWLDRSWGGTITGLKFTFRPYFDDGKGTDHKPATNFKYFDGSLYFSFGDFKAWAGFDTEKEQEKIDAPFAFKAIKEYFMNSRRERLENYKKELDELPKWFGKACKMAEKMRELVDSTSGFSTIHSFMYQNFEAKDVYFMTEH